MSPKKPKASLREVFRPRFFFTCFVGCIITLWIPMAEITATITRGDSVESVTTRVRMYQIYQQLPANFDSIRVWGYVTAHIGIVVLVSAFVWWLVLSADKISKSEEA